MPRANERYIGEESAREAVRTLYTTTRIIGLCSLHEPFRFVARARARLVCSFRSSSFFFSEGEIEGGKGEKLSVQDAREREFHF